MPGAAAWIVILPAGAAAGASALKLLSMKKKLFGAAAQVRDVVAPAVLLTLVRFRLKRVPEPESGVKSFEKAEIRNVRIGPPPGSTAADTFQLVAVRPAPETALLWKVTMVSSKVKSPWNPTRLSEALIVEVATGWVKSVTE